MQNFGLEPNRSIPPIDFTSIASTNYANLATFQVSSLKVKALKVISASFVFDFTYLVMLNYTGDIVQGFRVAASRLLSK